MIRPGLRYPRAWGALFLLLVAGITIGSLLPGELVATVSHYDKLEHVLAYGALCLLGCNITGPRHWLRVAIGCLLLGLLLELAQSFLTASRSADGWDLLANAVGVVLAAWLAQRGPGDWAIRIEAGWRAG